MSEHGLRVEREWPIDVWFRQAIIGRFQADLLVGKAVIVEVKAVRALLPEHHAQLIHYLRASTFDVGLLLNFGKSPEFKRLVYSGHARDRSRGLRSP